MSGMRPEIVTKSIKRDFSQDELLNMADQITESVQHLSELKRAKADNDKAHKEIVEQEVGTINKLSGMYRRGYEFSDTECNVLYNSPEEGQKTWVRIDTGEVIGSDQMTDDEKQETFPLAADEVEQESLPIRITETVDA